MKTLYAIPNSYLDDQVVIHLVSKMYIFNNSNAQIQAQIFELTRYLYSVDMTNTDKSEQ